MNLIFCQQINISVEREKKKKVKTTDNSPTSLRSLFSQAQVDSFISNSSAHPLGTKVHSQQNFPSATPFSLHFFPVLVWVAPTVYSSSRYGCSMISPPSVVIFIWTHKIFHLIFSLTERASGCLPASQSRSTCYWRQYFTLHFVNICFVFTKLFTKLKQFILEPQNMLSC